MSPLEPEIAAVPMPTATALLTESCRYSWWPRAWSLLEPDSRQAYDRWVAAVRRPSRSARRARLVTRRLWNGREFSGPLRRRLDAAFDVVQNAPLGAEPF